MAPQEALNLFRSRQSVRAYKSDPVDADILQRCIEAARIAPSACNAQPWKFIVVNNPELLSQLAPLLVTLPLEMNKFASQAPVLVVVVRENPNLTSRIGQLLKNKTYTLMDVGMASLQFCLQATAEGLGTCMMGWFNEKKVKKLLNIPSSLRAELVIAVGYPHNEEVREKVRKPLITICSENHY
jgi:nitroreductase